MKEEAQDITLLIRSLLDPDKKVIREAAQNLIALAPRSPELTQRLETFLIETSQEQRWAIAYVLAHIAPPSPACLQSLKDTLANTDPDIRWAAALLLSRLAKSRRDILDLLFDLIQSGTPSQRRMAIYTIRDTGAKDGRSLNVILGSLRDKDPMVRVAAVTSLRLRSEIGKRGLDELLHLFIQDPDARVRYAVALTLGQLGAPTKEIRRALKDALESRDPQLRKAAAAAFTRLEKKGPAPRTDDPVGGEPSVN